MKKFFVFAIVFLAMSSCKEIKPPDVVASPAAPQGPSESIFAGYQSTGKPDTDLCTIYIFKKAIPFTPIQMTSLKKAFCEQGKAVCEFFREGCKVCYPVRFVSPGADKTDVCG